MTQTRQIGPEPTTLRGADDTLRHLRPPASGGWQTYAGNLLVVTQERHLARVLATLDELGQPGLRRQVVAVLDRDPHAPAQASLVWVAGRHIERLVAPLRLCDLTPFAERALPAGPVDHLWWACDLPPTATSLADLTRLADQVILDTLGFDTGGVPLSKVADLAWARTARWRERTAQLFDSPEAQAAAPGLDHLRVRYVRDDRPARLYAAWVADRLGWPDLSGVDLLDTAGAAPGDLLGAELTGPDAAFRLTAQGQTLVSEVVCGGQTHRAESPRPQLSLAEGLWELMRTPLSDEGYARARHLLAARR